MDEADLKTTEESFDAIPEEVQQYIYSDDFAQKLAALFSEQNIDLAQQLTFKGTLFEYIAQIVGEGELLLAANTLGTTPEAKQKVITWLQENVADKISSLVTGAYVKEAADEETNEIAAQSERFKEPFSNLGARLSQPTIIAPIRRDYSLGKTPDQGTLEKKTDPYHEPIDE